MSSSSSPSPITLLVFNPMAEQHLDHGQGDAAAQEFHGPGMAQRRGTDPARRQSGAPGLFVELSPHESGIEAKQFPA